MNSSHHQICGSRSTFIPEAAARIAFSLPPFLCLLIWVLTLPAHAQNVLINGDFEAGTLAPWQGGELRANPSGGVLARVGDLRSGGISQTIATVPGQRYLLSAELRNETQFGAEIVMSAQKPGGDFDGFRAAVVIGTAPQHFTLSFTASTVSTYIAFQASSSFDVFLIDNVSLVPVARSTAHGSYVGTLATTVTVTDPAMGMKSLRKVTARINDHGEIVLLDGTNGIVTGSIAASGEFSLVLPDANTVTGKAVIRGRRISLEYIIGSHAAVTPSGAIVANTIKHNLTLTRR